MVIVETPLFTRRIREAMSDEAYAVMQTSLVGRPDSGAVIPGGGGLRKIRWAAEGRGKRGGVRIIYYWAVPQHTILMLFVYPKNVQADLTREQIKALRTIIEEEYP